MDSKKFNLSLIKSYVTEDPIMANRVAYIMRYFVLIFCWLYFTVLWSYGYFIQDIRPLIFISLPFLIFCNTLWWLYSRNRPLRHYHFTFQTVWDSISVILGIYVLGGLSSNFMFLGLITIQTTLIVSWRNMLLATLLVFGGLSFLFILPILGILPLPLGVTLETFEQISLHNVVAFIILAVLNAMGNAYYMWEIKKNNVELATLKDEIFSRTVHDLRAPLTILRWITSEFNTPDFLGKNPGIKDNILMAHRMEDQMNVLIQDALEVQRHNTEGIWRRPKSFDMISLLHEVVDSFKMLSLHNEVSLSLTVSEDSIQAFSFEQEIKEILTNLIDNAIKYNRPGGKVEVLAEVLNDKITISVKDNGIGISEDAKKKIFEAYFREQKDKNVFGTGLGLYLVKKMVGKVSGDISVKSEDGVGSEFVVTMPLSLK